MDNANVAEMTYRQSAIYIIKIWQMAKISNRLYSPMTGIPYHKIWLKLNEKYRSSSRLKSLTSKILQSAPKDPKELNTKNQA